MCVFLAVSCPVPTPVGNGFITSSVLTEYGYMERVKYGCSEGYILDGPMEIVCDESGQWSNKPTCKNDAK